MATQDWPSTVLAWVLAAVGIGVACIAAQMCHPKPYQATVCLTISSVITVQLLVLCVTSYVSKRWTVADIGTAKSGPSQQEQKMRRGLPALKTNRPAACGVDGWSVLVIVLLVLPIFVPLIGLHRPSAEEEWRTSRYDTIGTTRKSAESSAYYTTGAYEAISLAIHSIVNDSRRISMQNTADVALLTTQSMVAVPARLPGVCLHDEVRAKGVSTIFGEYFNCTWSIPARTSQVVDGKDNIAVSVTIPEGPGIDIAKQAVQFMKVKHFDATATCTVRYYVATADVVWKGADKPLERNCKIASLVRMSELQPLTSLGLMSSMADLSLPLRNAYQHVVSHDAIGKSSEADRTAFYGSIFAAATIIRSIDDRDDPGMPRDANRASTQGIPVKYTTETCFMYDWSAAIIAIIVLDIILVLTTTLYSAAGQGGLLQDLCSVCCSGGGGGSGGAKDGKAQLDQRFDSSVGVYHSQLGVVTNETGSVNSQGMPGGLVDGRWAGQGGLSAAQLQGLNGGLADP